MEKVQQHERNLLKSTIFCTCEDNYHMVKQAFDFKLNTISSILIKEEFLKEGNSEKFVYQSDVCYVIIALDKERDLKIAKYIYEIAKKKDILTIGIVIKPSFFENENYRETSKSQISWLKNNLDSLVIIDNQVFANNESEGMILDDLKRQSNDTVMDTLKSMINLISIKGLVNMDMAEFKNIMSGNTIAYPAFGCGSGINRAKMAAEQAIQSRLLIEPLHEATKQLLSIEGDSSMSLFEIRDIAEKITAASACNANIIFGAILNKSLKDRIKVSIISVGYKA